MTAIADLIRRCGVNWGSAADWTVAIATVAAFLAALLLYLNQRTQLAMLREDLERRLAARVVVWSKRVTTYRANDETRSRVLLELHNGGEEPAFDLDIAVSLPGYETREFRRHVLPPDDTTETFVDLAVVNPQVEGTEWRPIAVTIHAEWRDGKNRHWRRRADGTLEQIMPAKRILTSAATDESS
jgi:hypothetical protein